MHPALRKGPLFTKKTPHVFHFLQEHLHFPLFFNKTPPFSTFLQKAPPHFISCLRACIRIVSAHWQCPVVLDVPTEQRMRAIIFSSTVAWHGNDFFVGLLARELRTLWVDFHEIWVQADCEFIHLLNCLRFACRHTTL